MKRISAERIANAVTLLGEAFGRPVTEVTIKAYCLALSDLPDERLERIESIAVEASRTAGFMPTAKELRDLAIGTSAESRPTLAWAALQRIQFDPYQHMDFDDPLTNATIRSLGGWPAFVARFTNAEAEKWVRKEFIETYARLAAVRVNGDLCRPLAGLKEVEMRNGRQVPAIPRRVVLGLPAPTNVTPALSRPNAGAKPLLDLVREGAS